MRGSSECWERRELGGGEVHRVQGCRAPGEGGGWKGERHTTKQAMRREEEKSRKKRKENANKKKTNKSKAVLKRKKLYYNQQRRKRKWKKLKFKIPDKGQKGIQRLELFTLETTQEALWPPGPGWRRRTERKKVALHMGNT